MNAKKYLWVLSILLFLAVTLMIFLFQLNKQSSNPQVRDYPEIERQRTLNVVMKYTTPDYYPEENSIANMQYELCKFIAQKSGLNVNIIPENNLKTSIQYLENQTIDIIAHTIPVTEESRKLFAFTIPVTRNKQVLVQRKKESENDSVFISSQIDLAHKIIHLPRGSFAKLRIKNLSEEIAEPIYVEEIDVYEQGRIIQMVVSGEIDYAVIDKEFGTKNQKNFPEIDLHIDISFMQLQAWAVRKTSPALLDSLNCWIAEFTN